MIGPDGTEWVSIAEAAKRVRVREDLIRKWKYRGHIRAHRIGRDTYVHMADVATAERHWRHNGKYPGRGATRSTADTPRRMAMQPSGKSGTL